MEKRDLRLIQIELPDDSLLILTEEEFERTRLRGETVIHNRLLRDGFRDSTLEIIRAKKVIIHG